MIERCGLLRRTGALPLSATLVGELPGGYDPCVRSRSGEGRRSPALLGLVALVVLGAVATAFAIRNELNEVAQRDARSADDAATRIGASLEATVGALRGADAIAVRGAADPQAFQAFAQGVVTDSAYPALAYAEIVTGAERADFERSTGVEIRDTDGAGGLQPATPRDPSVVVVAVHPMNDTTRAVLGFDLAGDPVRQRAADAATQSATPVLSDRTSTVTGARAGVSVMHAVHDPSGEALGVVTSGLAVDELVRSAGVNDTSFDGLALSMDGQALLGSSPAGATQRFEVAGRTFEVTVDAEGGAGVVVPLLTGLGTVVLAGAVAWAARRDRLQRERLERLARRNRNIADLGRRFVATMDLPSVLDELAARAATILDADAALVVRTQPGGSDPVPVGAPKPSKAARALMSHAVRSAIDSGGLDAPEPYGSSDAANAGRGEPDAAFAHVMSAPLLLSTGWCVGAVAVGWSTPLTVQQSDDRGVALTTIADLASRAAERAVIAEVVQQRSQQLSEVARALAAAHTSDDVGRVAFNEVPALIGAERVALLAQEDLTENDDASTTSEVLLTDANSQPVGSLSIEWPPSMELSDAETALVVTVANLISQTLERTALSDQEHEVVAQLQQALLPSVPHIDGLELATRYQPAMSVVGLGGDFYDVVVNDAERTVVIVGDITGHGPAAVAAMAELKSVLHHLLRASTPLREAVEQADVLLERRGILATALLVEIDMASDEVTCVNAGHPYPVLRPLGAQPGLLREGQGPLLGLGLAGSGPGGRSVFREGDVLLLYTDGLIETRTRDIDDCMQDLVDAVRSVDATIPMEGLLDRIQAVLLTGQRGVDDDVAMVAIRRHSVADRAHGRDSSPDDPDS